MRNRGTVSVCECAVRVLCLRVESCGCTDESILICSWLCLYRATNRACCLRSDSGGKFNERTIALELLFKSWLFTIQRAARRCTFSRALMLSL